MKKVRALLEGKSGNVWSVSPNDSVYDAIAMMAEKNIGAVLVMEEDKLVGVMSERDYARKVILAGHSSKETSVSAVMTERVIFVKPHETVEECMALMTERRIRHLPVMEEGKLLGVVSIGDLVKAVISEQQFMIEQLENYITGG
ncbi:MAG TPA: CBS domain-containing protein [Salinisphaeraceae bacterium]|nr:CBS domain-containing protein [Salinisphaeraceae bacterium]